MIYTTGARSDHQGQREHVNKVASILNVKQTWVFMSGVRSMLIFPENRTCRERRSRASLERNLSGKLLLQEVGNVRVSFQALRSFNARSCFHSSERGRTVIWLPMRVVPEDVRLPQHIVSRIREQGSPA